MYGKKALDAENFNEARILLNKAYDKGNVLAGILLGTLYYYGVGCEKDMNKAQEVFLSCKESLEAMCASGALDAQYAY